LVGGATLDIGVVHGVTQSQVEVGGETAKGYACNTRDVETAASRRPGKTGLNQFSTGKHCGSLTDVCERQDLSAAIACDEKPAEILVGDWRVQIFAYLVPCLLPIGIKA
jgi:hypothetical protein